MPEDNAPQKQLQPVQFESAPEGVLEVYCNFFNVNWSLFDIRIRLGQLVPTREADVSKAGQIPRVAKERAALTLAWPEAKLLRDALNDAIARFEKKNWVIVTPQLPD